jgi:hypothetical protein
MTPGSRIWAKVPYHPTVEPEPASSAMKPRRLAAQASPHTPPMSAEPRRAGPAGTGLHDHAVVHRRCSVRAPAGTCAAGGSYTGRPPSLPGFVVRQTG